MKLVYYDDFTLGVLRGEEVVDVSGLVQEIPHVGPHDLISRLIESFDQYRPRLEQAAKEGKGISVEQVRLRAPLPKPGKIVCMAGNYLENGALKEARPINAFLKNRNAVMGDGDTVLLPSADAPIFHHEAELGLVIGKQASHVAAAQAYDHIFGCVNFIDVSARGLGPPGADTFFTGKGYHTFAPLGPYLVTADEIPDLQNVAVQLWVNGELLSDYNTNDMGHSIPKAIEWLSSIITLNPGDVIACGTNHQGLGALQDGDRVEIANSGLGRLHVTISDPLHREWPRGIDREIGEWVAGRSTSPPAWMPGAPPR